MFFRSRCRANWLGPVFWLLAGVAALSASAATENDDGELKLAIILSRHGVRSPITPPEVLNRYSAEPWPAWPVPPSYLTPHGRQEMELMGAYYRAFYTREGLLTGKPDQDRSRIFLRTNSIQRTVETGRALAAGLAPGEPVTLHARAPDVIDPLFEAAKLPVGRIDHELGLASVFGRIGGNPAAVEQANAPALHELEQVLFGPDALTPPGKTALLDEPTQIQAGATEVIAMKGALSRASSIVDSLLLEYAEGMPRKDVGWGRMTPPKLTDLLQLHALYFNLSQGGFYPAQVQASNIASHILQTLEQAASGHAQPGALGTPEQKLVVLVGHDTTQINLGALLRLDWWLPGTQRNPVLPGGAMVLELRQRHRDGQWRVRTYYVSPTLEQIRALTPMTLEHPPAISPIFIPDCSEPGPSFDAPLGRFEALLHRVIDPEFVLPNAD